MIKHPPLLLEKKRSQEGLGMSASFKKLTAELDMSCQCRCNGGVIINARWWFFKINIV